VTGDVLAKLIATCSTDSLRDVTDRAILMVAFASGGRRRSEIAGLRLEQLTVEAPIEMADGPPLPSIAIHLGRTKTTSGEADDVVYLTRRPVEALNAWTAAANIDKGSVFREIGRWGTVSKRALDPQSVNAILKQRAEMAGLEPGEFSAHGLRSGYLTEAANRGIRSRRRWSNHATDPFSKHPAIITVLHGEAGERPDCCRIGSHCQNCQGEINSSPVVSKSLRFRVASRPPLIRAIAAIMPSGADIPLPCREASPMISP
jgi:hypothetical protein